MILPPPKTSTLVLSSLGRNETQGLVSHWLVNKSREDGHLINYTYNSLSDLLAWFATEIPEREVYIFHVMVVETFSEKLPAAVAHVLEKLIRRKKLVWYFSDKEPNWDQVKRVIEGINVVNLENTLQQRVI